MKATEPRLQSSLTERDRRIVDSVLRYSALNRDQVRVLASFGSVTRVNARLKRLVDDGYLRRRVLPVIPGRGSAQALYAPGRLADKRPDRSGRWTASQLAHVVAANQVLVDAIRGSAAMPAVSLIQVNTERELRRLLTERELVPDGWFAWSQSGRRYNAFVELDLHHEGLAVWRSKILRYLAYLEAGLHQELFGFRAFRVLVVARTMRRLNNIRRVAAHIDRAFLFSTIKTVCNGNVFGPVWLRAQGNEPISLVEA